MEYRKTMFTIDDCGQSFEGYTKGQLWNGWECPYFTKEVGLKIANHFTQPDLPAGFDGREDAFWFSNEGCEDEDIFKGEDRLVNGEIIHLYPIGACSWIWSEVIEDEEEEEEADGSLLLFETELYIIDYFDKEGNKGVRFVAAQDSTTARKAFREVHKDEYNDILAVTPYCANIIVAQQG